MVSNTRFWVYLHFSKIIHKYSLKSNVLGQLLKVNPLLLCESAPLIYMLGKHVTKKWTFLRHKLLYSWLNPNENVNKDPKAAGGNRTRRGKGEGS